MSCSLITVIGERKVKDSDALEFARISGLSFIRLGHIKGSAEGDFGQRGFQSVSIRVVTDRNGGRKYVWEGSKDKYSGEPCMGQRQLIFTPEKHTGLLTADLPDTPFNRRVLVSCYFNNAQWKIIDSAIDAEIREKAEALQKTLSVKPSKEKIIVEMSDENKRLEEEIRRLREALNIRHAADEVIKDTITPSKDDGLGALKLSVAEEKKLKAEARAEIYVELEDRMTEIKEEKGAAWFSSKEYREEILPVINARYQKKLEEKYANNSGTGSDN